VNEIDRYQVNRIVVILVPKLPFLQLISTVESRIKLTLDELRVEQDALLLSILEIETLQGAKAWAYRNWKVLFDKALCDWYTDRRYWPPVRTFELFELSGTRKYGISLVRTLKKWIGSETKSRLQITVIPREFNELCSTIET
jgi:hypothetical protein